ncbi:MAG: DEAD/DEAH box helicase, partial [Suilimivivens sp.]
MEIQISVRNLVEFILRSGSIDNRRSKSPDNAMQEGGRIHRMIQRRMGSEYHAEVFLRHQVDTENYSIVVEGRADGIILQSEVTIDEIKGTYREIHRIKEAVPVHLAQAKCYAYMYGIQNNLKTIRVRITYCNIDTEEIKYFHFEYDMEELIEWFDEIMASYRKWADFQFEWQKKRQQSIKELAFPFEYRSGQKELVTYVYQTIYHKKKLFIEAPTGVGKTISTLFPAVKSMGEGRGQKIFYLTAKTITRTVADNTLEIMRQKGLQFKSVILTAKDKICFMEETECNPEYCPYAKGHFDRINEALYDLLTNADNFNREAIEEYALKHQVCPFEMCLDMSLFADAVICDYNYLFDPHVYLKRFFSEGIREDYIFLIDEAHNLVERAREMYSASLYKEDFLEVKRFLKPYSKKATAALEKGNKYLLEWKRECENYTILSGIDSFAMNLLNVSSALEQLLEDRESV